MIFEINTFNSDFKIFYYYYFTLNNFKKKFKSRCSELLSDQAPPHSKFWLRPCSILCESLGKSGRAYEALEYFRDMTKKGIFVSSSVYSSLIRSFAGIRDLTVVEELFKEAKEKRMVGIQKCF